MYDNNARITNIFSEFYLIIEGFLVKFVYTEQLVTNPLSIEMNYLIYFNMLDNFDIFSFL